MTGNWALCRQVLLGLGFMIRSHRTQSSTMTQQGQLSICFPRLTSSTQLLKLCGLLPQATRSPSDHTWNQTWDLPLTHTHTQKALHHLYAFWRTGGIATPTWEDPCPELVSTTQSRARGLLLATLQASAMLNTGWKTTQLKYQHVGSLQRVSRPTMWRLTHACMHTHTEGTLTKELTHLINTRYITSVHSRWACCHNL